MAIYNPTAVALTSITLPADGENIDAVDVNAPLQSLADGLKYFGGSAVADLTALAAIAAPTDGTIRHVVGQGWYVFKTSATSGPSPFRIAASDATAGGWLSSTAHETTRTRWVAAAHITGITGTSGGAVAEVPTTDAISFISTGLSVTFRAGHMRTSVSTTSATNAYGFCIPLDPFLIDGSTLSSATLLYRPTAHGVAPLQFPRLAVIRSPKAGPYTVVPTQLLSTGGGIVQDSGGTYVSDRALVFTPNQNNVIDTSLYTYMAIFWDEHSTNAVSGNGYSGISLVMTNVVDARR